MFSGNWYQVEKQRVILIFGNFWRVIPTICYNVKHTQHEEPEEESNYEPQQHQKYPAKDHGNRQATKGKIHNTHRGQVS